MKSFEEVKAYTDKIISSYGERDALYKEIDDAFLLEEIDMPNENWIKITMSPDARNKTLGAVRLLTAADPVWSVPREKNKDELNEETADSLEKAAAMMWTASGRIRKTPLHYTASLSGVLYGEIDIAIISVNELIANEKNPAKKRRLEKIAKKTPLIWEVLSPKICYPVYDVFGLAAHVVFREIKVIDATNRLGTVAQQQLEGQDKTKDVEFYEYWDEEIHAIWLGGQDQPIILKEHELPTIPIASAIVEGGDLFEDEKKWQPFLYSTIKGKIHARDSLILTLMYSNAFATGATPVNVYETNNVNKSLVIDYDTPGGVIKIERGESLTPMKRDTIDQSMKELYQITQQKAEESTIYSQTLGEPMGGNAPYSMVALLSQSGRLPLIPYQRMASNVITDAMTLGIEILRSQNYKKFKVGQTGVGINIDLSQIPEDVELVATLGIEMPQDEFSQARIAMELVKAELMSIEKAREKYLNVGQSSAETRQIYKEKYVKMLSELEFQRKAQEMQMKQQQELQNQMMQQQQGGGGMVPPGAGQGMPQMPPDGMMQPPPGGGGQPGDMMEGMSGIPGEMPMQMPQQLPGQNPEEGMPPMEGGI